MNVILLMNDYRIINERLASYEWTIVILLMSDCHIMNECSLCFIEIRLYFQFFFVTLSAETVSNRKYEDYNRQ